MNRPLSKSAPRIGTMCAAFGLILIGCEWYWGIHELHFFVNLIVLSCMVLWPVCLYPLGKSIHRRPLRCLILWGLLTGCCIAFIVSSLTFRTNLAKMANNGHRRWYFEGMPNPENDYQSWLEKWNSHTQLILEAGVIAICFALVTGSLLILRPHRVSTVTIGLVSYLLLVIPALAFGLLAPDYDLFLTGVSLDSIALTLLPFSSLYGDAHNIHGLTFFLILFMSSWVFLRLYRPTETEISTAAPAP